MLTNAEVASMRATQNSALPGTAIISRYTQTADGMGGVVVSWASIGTVTARLGPVMSGVELQIADRITEIDVWPITMPQGTDIDARDKLSIGTRSFEVISIGEHGPWETALRVMAAEIGGS